MQGFGAEGDVGCRGSEECCRGLAVWGALGLRVVSGVRTWGGEGFSGLGGSSLMGFMGCGFCTFRVRGLGGVAASRFRGGVGALGIRGLEMRIGGFGGLRVSGFGDHEVLGFGWLWFFGCGILSPMP